MEFASITQMVVYLVFVLALLAFSLSPAIWISQRISPRSAFYERHSMKFSIFLALIFSSLATTFIFMY